MYSFIVASFISNSRFYLGTCVLIIFEYKNKTNALECVFVCVSVFAPDHGDY